MGEPTMTLENAISMMKSLRRIIVCHHDDYEMVKEAVAGHPYIEVKASGLTVPKGRAYILDPAALDADPRSTRWDGGGS